MKYTNDPLWQLMKQKAKNEREDSLLSSTSRFRVGMRVRVQSRRGKMEGVIARMGKQRWFVFCETPGGRIEWSGPPSMMEPLPEQDPVKVEAEAREAQAKLREFRNERQANLDKRHGDFQVGDEVEWSDGSYKRNGRILRFGKSRWVVQESTGKRWYIPARLMTRKAGAA